MARNRTSLGWADAERAPWTMPESGVREPQADTRPQSSRGNSRRTTMDLAGSSGHSRHFAVGGWRGQPWTGGLRHCFARGGRGSVAAEAAPTGPRGTAFVGAASAAKLFHAARARPLLQVAGIPRQVQLRRIRDQHPLGLQIARRPVALVQAIHAHPTAPAGRVNEAVIANVDAGMIHLSLAPCAEEDDVARPQLIPVHPGRVVADHLARGARQVNAGLVAEQVTDEAAAIETARHRGAAVTVAGADQLETALEQALHPALLAALAQGDLAGLLQLGLQRRQPVPGFIQGGPFRLDGGAWRGGGGAADQQAGEG